MPNNASLSEWLDDGCSDLNLTLGQYRADWDKCYRLEQDVIGTVWPDLPSWRDRIPSPAPGEDR